MLKLVAICLVILAVSPLTSPFSVSDVSEIGGAARGRADGTIVKDKPPSDADLAHAALLQAVPLSFTLSIDSLLLDPTDVAFSSRVLHTVLRL